MILMMAGDITEGFSLSLRWQNTSAGLEERRAMLMLATATVLATDLAENSRRFSVMTPHNHLFPLCFAHFV